MQTSIVAAVAEEYFLYFSMFYVFFTGANAIGNNEIHSAAFLRAFSSLNIYGSHRNVELHISVRIAAAAEDCPSLAKKKVGPHTFRHTTAMHLLQSGVDLTVIKNWLGHVNLDTTHAYVQIDLEMKRKALASCAPACKIGNLRHLIKRNNDIICWLESL